MIGLLANLILIFTALFLVAYGIWQIFLTPRTPVKASLGKDGVQRVSLEVNNGYHPAVIEAQSDHPLNMRFYRIENSPCSEEIVLRDFGIWERLPAYTTTSVEILPFQPGEYTFGCGNNVLEGKLIIR
ncbi:MAG: cupredoxin domain-containing protein [Candidatus Marinimicrobia bacterium]|nr:cupredoxin domain-containing protein [Candidatus Neomarinimicrobiota bacterium]MCF7829769.1 cupredoxin domain-containing protein [Candidatus Neomarinimicrobiota bacterium]MCF7881719.1 cupredoxin domain-containing protein [Candidatus Neomarinimicrobiota bacterium]